jgi:predicted RNA-binding Zn-ribbon protein involved in translation (DUF1610 family)
MIRSTLRRLLSDSMALYECRSCGTTLDADQEMCPACGSDEIARYDLAQQ